MKKLLMLAGALCAVLILPGLASATHFNSLNVDADCEGFTAHAEVYFRDVIFQVDVDYSLVLTDDAGLEVARFEGTDPVDRIDGRLGYMDGGELWGVELCGTYHVTASVHLYSEYGTDLFDEDTMTFETSFTCICDDPDEPCHRTPGYWKNHEEMWGADHLMLGGVDMSQAELLEIMWTPVRGDATIILAYHTIAAKLNVLNGADDSINDVIADADDYLAMYPVGSKPKGDAKEDGLAIKNLLVAYNELDCLEDDDMDDYDDMGKALGTTEETTFDNLKALYK